MRIGVGEFDPALNPAVLDTATWDRDSAWQLVREAGNAWAEVLAAARDGRDLPHAGSATPYAGSCVPRGDGAVLLAGCSDGQNVFVEIGSTGAAEILGQALGRVDLPGGGCLAAYPADADVIDKYCRSLKPEKAPRAMKDTPRLGIGCRMTTAVWPGMFAAMERRGFAANTIQNSVRELNFLDDIAAGRHPARNYACGFGTIETGYTGSTFEGLWVSGVLAVLQHPAWVRYGADADHIQVKRGAEGLDLAKRTIDAARYYTFYTLDMSDVLHYDALTNENSNPDARNIPDPGERREVLAWHGRERRFGDRTYAMSPAVIAGFVGKYWEALDAMGELCSHIRSLKHEQPFDLEFTIDEHPPEIAAFDCLTSAEEALFVLSEIDRRGLPVTHIAPNFGMEKGWDYRCPDGLDGLHRRVRAQFDIAEQFGVMLDFHSADDLTSAPRKILRQATGGRLHYKVSPMPQIIFADVLREFDPELFMRWWDDAMAYARSQAAAGSQFARECMEAYEAAKDKTPSHHHAAFHHYSFAFVGRRNDCGGFLHRHEFYALSPGFYRAYQDRISAWLCELADELF